MEIRATPADYAKLLERNALAGEQLKGIILERMYGELVAQIETMKAAVEEIKARYPESPPVPVGKSDIRAGSFKNDHKTDTGPGIYEEIEAAARE